VAAGVSPDSIKTQLLGKNSTAFFIYTYNKLFRLKRKNPYYLKNRLFFVTR